MDLFFKAGCGGQAYCGTPLVPSAESAAIPFIISAPDLDVSQVISGTA